MEEQYGEVCIRLKRQKETYFFICKQYEGIQSIKRKIITFFKGVQTSDIRLYLGQNLLDQKSNLHDQGIVNNSIVYFKLKKGTTGEWEEIPQLAATTTAATTTQ